MKLIVGLGNPGEKFTDTRHNVGFSFVEGLQTTVYGSDNWKNENKLKSLVCRLTSVDCLLAKPQTFMNESGVSVRLLSTYYHILPTNIYVVHDDLDIKLGEYKIQFGIGPKVHGGVSSIEDTLGTINFWRVRIGVDNRDPENRIPGETYVLQSFTDNEIEIINKTFEKVIKELIPNFQFQISNS